MATATHEARTEPIPADSGAIDTGPQAILELSEQGLTQRRIADRLLISQATVWRRLREAIEARKERRRAILVNIMLAWLTLLATVATAAWATMAWH